jgi:hypothetical protein
MTRARRRGPGAWLAALAIAVVAGGGACSTVDLGDPPADVNLCRPDQGWFVNQVWPNYLTTSFNGKMCGDASCHGAGTGNGLLVVTPTSTPTLPLDGEPDWDAVYLSAAMEMNCNDVRSAKLFAYPAGLNPAGHGGGMLFDPNDATGAAIFTILDQWIHPTP